MGNFPAGTLIKLSPSDLSASAHTAGDVVFAKAELKNAVPSRGGCSVIRTINMFVEGAAGDDDLALFFFDNSTDLGEPAADPASDITADEFRTASCIGMMKLDAGNQSTEVANGRLYTNSVTVLGDSAGILVKAADGETSIWVACVQYAGTLDLTDTDSITCTFGVQYLG